eukprot:jgi/Chlat1/6666/Chrsp49S06154
MRASIDGRTLPTSAGGGGGAGGGSDEAAGVRNAEVLFETRTVAEIREVEARTRKEVEDKKEELRQLVGASYRNLIESADSILGMQAACNAVVSNLLKIQQQFSAFHTDEEDSSDSAEAREANKQREERARLLSLGSRVKFIVDTPEMIWGCLDQHLFLEAAHRYLRACEVEELLVGRLSRRQLHSEFPLLKHQLPLVESLKAVVRQRSTERLQELELSPSDCAVALSAIAVLDGLSSSQVLDLYFGSRRKWLRSHLRAAQMRVNAGESIASALCEIASGLQHCVSTLGELFMAPAAGTALLYDTALANSPDDRLFGGIPQPQEEVQSWEGYKRRLSDKLVAVPSETVTTACRHWIESCAADFEGDGRGLLSSTPSVQDVATIEKQVKSELQRKDAFKESAAWLEAHLGSLSDDPWDSNCQVVLRRPLDIWKVFFHKTLVQRAKDIINSAFQAVGIWKRAEVVLHSISQNEPQQTTSPALQPSGWNVFKNEQDFALLTGKNMFLDARVTVLAGAVDDLIFNILDDVLCLTTGSDGRPSSGNREAAAELEPYLQERCYHTVSDAAKELQHQLSTSSAVANGNSAAGLQAADVEKALFIGRLFAALAEQSASIPVVLGPPSSWHDRIKGVTSTSSHASIGQRRRLSISEQSMTPRTSTPKSASRRSSMIFEGSLPSPRLQQLQLQLRQGLIAGYRVWVSWTVEHLVAEYSASLRADDLLSTTTPLKGWEVVEITSEEAGEKEVIDCFKHFSEWSEFNTHVSEKGVLQLLFDARFLSDILAGASDPATEDSGGVADALLVDPKLAAIRRGRMPGDSTALRRSQWTALLESLQRCLDPIDWATYESYLWANAQRYYQRCAVLYGALVQLKRLYTDVPQRKPFSNDTFDTNIVNMSASTQRFTYLPISTPLLTSHTTRSPSTDLQKRLLSSRVREARNPVASSSSNGSASGQADVSSSAIENGKLYAPLKNILMGQFGQVGSKFGETLPKFQSMLTDAKLRPLDVLPSSSLFSSLTSVRD